LKFTVAPEFWFRHEHLDYEQLVGLADNKLDATDREIIDIHLKVCASCPEDVRSFLAFREQLARETQPGYAPDKPQPTGEKFPWFASWLGLGWKPVYGAALVVIGIAIVIGVVLFLNHTDKQQAQQRLNPQVSPSSSPDNRAATVQSPPVGPKESPKEKPNSAEAILVLNERGGKVTIDKSGNVSGLDDVSAPTREEIAKVLLSEKLGQPAILKQLGAQEGSLRGSKNASPFKLISPSRTVIVTDRPTLKWEKAPGASSYRVYVNDFPGHEVARSEELSSQLTTWTFPKALKRGEVYDWTVVAVVDGKEIVSPGPSSPEMKFQVLPIRDVQQLRHLKKTRSHLALGIFYTKVGMTDAAEREFQELVRLNPDNRLARKLLRSVRLMQGTPR